MSIEIVGLVDAYGPTGELLVEAFKKRGVVCVHVTSSTTALPEFRATFCPENFRFDILHAGSVEETAAKLASLGVRHVLPGIELGVPLAWNLNGIADVRSMYNKYYQGEAVRSAGKQTMRQSLCSSPSEALAWAARNRLDELVAKAPASAGTDGVLWCAAPLTQTLPSAFAAILGKVNKLGRINEAVLVQERLHGTEYVVDLVRCRDVAQVAALFKYTKCSANGSAFVYHSMDLLRLDEERMLERVKYAEAVVNSILPGGFASATAIHMEIIDDTLVECGFRAHGGQGASIGAECTGQGQIEMLAHAVTDPNSFCDQKQISYNPARYAKEVFLISQQTGEFIEFGRLADLQALPSFKRLAPKVRAGAKITPTIDLLTCPGSVVLMSSDREQIEKDAARIREIELDGLYVLV